MTIMALMGNGNGNRKNGNGHGHWHIQREKILLFAGLVLIAATFVAYVIIREVRYEFLMTGLALCGIGIAQWGDKKDR